MTGGFEHKIAFSERKTRKKKIKIINFAIFTFDSIRWFPEQDIAQTDPRKYSVMITIAIISSATRRLWAHFYRQHCIAMLIRNVVNSGLDFTADLITDARHQQKISVFALRTNARLSIHYRFFFSCNEFVQSSIRTFVFTENNCSKISPNPIRSSEIIEEILIENGPICSKADFIFVRCTTVIILKPLPRRSSWRKNHSQRDEREKKYERNKYYKTEVVEDTHKQLLLFISFQTRQSECAASSRDAHTHVRRPLDCTRATHS